MKILVPQHDLLWEVLAVCLLKGQNPPLLLPWADRQCRRRMIRLTTGTVL